MRLSRRFRVIVAAVVATVAGLAAALFLLAWSGVYNIAASRGHWAIVEWLLAFGMRNSVELRAHFVGTPPNLGAPDLYTLGAAHFYSGCAYCHGAPGMPLPLIPKHMLPPPPDLAVAATQWKDRELFWIVMHGIKYTGMPAWAAQRRDDEVWALAAFLKQLPRLDAQRYRELAFGGLEVAAPAGRDIATADAAAAAVGACARCHGGERGRPASALVPVLHGQPRAFLAAALQAFAEGRRESGVLQPAAAELPPEAAGRVAQFYAGLPPPAAAAGGTSAETATLERGRALALEGVPGARIPPCRPCHDQSALAEYPRLAGQNAPYMRGRLLRWKSGIDAQTDTDAIMAPIARLLSEQQIDDVVGYFSTLAPPPAVGAAR
jgi:cytochrome c553